MVIVFIDIRGFSLLSQKLGVQGTMLLINGLSKRIIPIVKNHDGYVDV